MSEPRIALVAAVARNGVIGKDGDLPWRLPSDLRRFRDLTMSAPVIMGRKTWESLPNPPLKGRINIVVSGQAERVFAGAVTVADTATALTFARIEATALGSDIMVIGGATIYTNFMDKADTLYITEVHAEPDGDVHFPKIEQTSWREVQRVNVTGEDKDDFDYDLVRYERAR